MIMKSLVLSKIEDKKKISSVAGSAQTLKNFFIIFSCFHLDPDMQV